jgi:hypothetical protein
MSRSADTWIALAQGAFYVATGVWALVDAAAEVGLACAWAVARRRA